MSSLGCIFRTLDMYVSLTLCSIIWSGHSELVYVQDCITSEFQSAWSGEQKICCNPRARQSAAVFRSAKAECVMLRGHNEGMRRNMWRYNHVKTSFQKVKKRACTRLLMLGSRLLTRSVSRGVFVHLSCIYVWPGHLSLQAISMLINKIINKLLR